MEYVLLKINMKVAVGRGKAKAQTIFPKVSKVNGSSAKSKRLQNNSLQLWDSVGLFWTFFGIFFRFLDLLGCLGLFANGYVQSTRRRSYLSLFPNLKHVCGAPSYKRIPGFQWRL